MQRRPGSFPGSGDPASVLSPRSSETGALGVNMAEYVLGGSPVGKELDARLHGIKPPYLSETEGGEYLSYYEGLGTGFVGQWHKAEGHWPTDQGPKP